MRLRHVVALVVLAGLGLTLALWLPGFLDRRARVRDRAARPVRIVVSRTIARADGGSEFVRADDRDGVTSVEFEAHTPRGGAKTTVAERRTNAAAVLYETLRAAGFWSLPDDARGCPGDAASGVPKAAYCARVVVRYEDGGEIRERAAAFDDRAVARRAPREMPLDLSHQTGAEALRSIRLDSARVAPGAYARVQAAFAEFLTPDLAAVAAKVRAAADVPHA